MFNVGGGELLVILLIALIVLGPQRLPDAARQVGKVMSEVRRVSSGFQRELKDAFDASEAETGVPPRRREATPLAATVAEADAAANAGADARTPAGGEAAETTEPPAGDAPATGTGSATAEATTPQRPVGEPTAAPDPQLAPAVADALDEIVAPVGDERAAS